MDWFEGTERESVLRLAKDSGFRLIFTKVNPENCTKVESWQGRDHNPIGMIRLQPCGFKWAKVTHALFSACQLKGDSRSNLDDQILRITDWKCPGIPNCNPHLMAMRGIQLGRLGFIPIDFITIEGASLILYPKELKP